MRFVVILALMFAPTVSTLALDVPDRHPPSEFPTSAALRMWIESDKGFGEPEMVEAELIGLHVFVAWNCPFSGRNGRYAYTYVKNAATGTWKLIDSSFFETPETRLGIAV